MMTERPAANTSAEDRIFDEAARWYSKRLSGLSAKESAALLEWLKAAPEHAAALELVATAWDESAESARAATLRPELLRAKNFELADFSRHRPHRKSWVPGVAGGALAACVCLIFAGLSWTSATSDISYRTRRGDNLSVALRDGSRLTLGSETSVRVHIDPLHREAWLDGGEADFDIAHEAARHFKVSVRGVTVRDLGTRFTVRDRKGPVRVVLVAGQAEVLTAGEASRSAVLMPGQQVIIAAQSVAVSQADLASVLAWRDGRIVLKDVTLAEALAEWRDVAPVDFDIQDPALAKLRISGAYRTTDVVSFLNGLSRVRPVAWQETSANHFSLRSTAGRSQL